MIKNTKINKTVKINGGNNWIEIRLDLDLSRIKGNLEEAQKSLDIAVMEHMVPYMPMVTHTFVNLTRAISSSMAGTGIVCAAAPPYGRFLYEGKTMVGETSGRPVAQFGEKKVLVSQYRGYTKASPLLTYNTQAHPDAQAKWFDAAKRDHLDNWVSLVKKKAGGK